jgi:hypothetical protein
MLFFADLRDTNSDDDCTTSIFEPVEHGSIFEGKMKKNSAGFS